MMANAVKFLSLVTSFSYLLFLHKLNRRHITHFGETCFMHSKQKNGFLWISRV